MYDSTRERERELVERQCINKLIVKINGGVILKDASNLIMESFKVCYT